MLSGNNNKMLTWSFNNTYLNYAGVLALTKPRRNCRHENTVYQKSKQQKQKRSVIMASITTSDICKHSFVALHIPLVAIKWSLCR